MPLTKKQEIFCIEVLKQDTLSDAYRIAYSTKRMSDKQINEEASILHKNPKITQRLKELKQKVEDKELYTLKQSIQRDLRLIERYESALDVLENNKSQKNEIEAAERTIRFIGASGYSNAQDRLSKQHGFFERDNKQKVIPPRQIVDMSDYKKKE